MNNEKAINHIFGPVPSRRLGRSLGIDVIPFKTCTYDCIYCQLGRTTNKSIKRENYVRTDEIVRSVARALKKGEVVDYLTLSGSGEPTLHAGIGRIINTLKREFDIPVAVLTNGSLLFEPKVADALMQADVVMPTLAADCETVFQCVHRPHPGLHFDTIISGIREFAARFKHRLWLEVFLLDGVTAIEKTVESMKTIIDAIGPEKVQINTATRPAAEDFAFPVPEYRLVSLGRILGPHAEIISDFKSTSMHKTAAGKDTENAVLALLSRRPCTKQDVADALSLHHIEAVKLLAELAEQGRIGLRKQRGRTFYSMRTGVNQ